MHTLLRPGILVLLTLGAALLWPAPAPVGAAGVTAISAGGAHTCVLTTENGVMCWGINQYGQLGASTTEVCGASDYSCSTTPVDVTGLSDGVAAVSAGGSHTCALTTGGGVKCWGSNEFGQLGNGTAGDGDYATFDNFEVSPVDVIGLETGVVAVSAGGRHTCALTVVGGVRCWGSNGVGQLGDGNYGYDENRYPAISSSPVDVLNADGALLEGIIAVDAGRSHTCAVTTSGGAKCWGYNTYNQLGTYDGDIVCHVNPPLASPPVYDCSPVPLDVAGLTSGVVAVAGGGNHTCALLETGSVKCWGWNSHGQIGVGVVGTCTFCSYEPQDVVDLDSSVAAIRAGAEHACALTMKGGVKCWGWNTFGELGDGTWSPRRAPIDVLQDDVNPLYGLSGLAAGSYHTCALTTEGGVKCWGQNDYGQLGAVTTEMCHFDSALCSTTPVDVVGLESVAGDVDCSKAVTIADAQLIAQLVVGRISGLPCSNNGDVDESGGVTIADAQLIAQLVVGRISTLVPS